MSADEYTVEDPDLVQKFQTDGRGRVRLGKDFADCDVKVAVQRIKQDDSTGDDN